jgi:glycosyltransferase involved in cell wall biosynthesis
MENKKQPKISIVTVAFNCEDIIEETIQSVIAQTYPNIEYVIIEGKSKDGTLDVVEKYREHVDILVSEKDKNLYDAMNKGMAHATGDYIWFLHAGDVALEPETLEKAFANHNDEDFVYGKVKVVDVDGNEIPWHKKHPKAETLSWRSFRNGMVICHQAMFPHRRIWEDYNFEEYTLVADLDWSLRIMKKAKTFRDTDTVVCSFLKGGISAQNRKASLWERFAILRKHFGLAETLWEHVLIAGQALRRGKISH